MKKKQQFNTLFDKETNDLVAANRKTYLALKNDKYEPKRVQREPILNAKKAELAAYKKELALKHGSKTGKLKKKHLFREKMLNLILNGE
jgi:spore coat protein CotH